MQWLLVYHDDVIKWKDFSRYWPFVRRIHRSLVKSTHEGQWCGALMFSLICAQISGWVNNREAGDLRRHRAHYDVIVMQHLSLAITITAYMLTSNGVRPSAGSVLTYFRVHMFCLQVSLAFTDSVTLLLTRDAIKYSRRNPVKSPDASVMLLQCPDCYV